MSQYSEGKIISSSISEQDLKKLLDMVEAVHYGSVTLVIQDGKVIQFERNEKVRLKQKEK